MNNDNKALDTLVSEMIKGVKTYCKKLDFDRTYTGIVSSVNSDGYTVKYNGTEINIKTTSTDVFKKGDMVKFCVPCGNKMKAFIVNKPISYGDTNSVVTNIKSINIADKFIVDKLGNAKIYKGKYYIADTDGFIIYSSDNNTPIAKIGFPSGGKTCSYIKLYANNTDEQSVLFKRMTNGFWQGNDAPIDDVGDFEPKDGYNGMFYNFDESATYIINGTDMQKLYTGNAVARFG